MFYFPKVLFILWLCGENVLRRYMLKDSRVKYMVSVTFQWFSQKKKKKLGRNVVTSCPKIGISRWKLCGCFIILSLLHFWRFKKFSKCLEIKKTLDDYFRFVVTYLTWNPWFMFFYSHDLLFSSNCSVGRELV